MRTKSVPISEIRIGPRHRRGARGLQRLARRIHSGDLMARAESEALPLSKRVAVYRHLELLMARKGFVYFIQGRDSKLIKIGFSGNVPRRLKQLRRHSGEAIEVLAAFQGTNLDERRLHKRLHDARVHHEWFLPTVEVLACVQKAKEGADA